MKLPEPTIYKSKIKTASNDNTFDEYRYDISNRHIDKNQLDNLVRQELKQMLEDDGSMYVSVSYWSDKIYATDVEQVNTVADVEKIELNSVNMKDYDEDPLTDESIEITYVSIFVAKASEQVGCDENNDCLYNALCQAFIKLPKVLQCPIGFKKWLGIKPTAKVDLSHLPKIEKALKINIETVGEYTYKSDVVYPRGIKLRVKHQHIERVYSFPEYKQFLSGYRKRKERPFPIFFKKNPKEGTVKLCLIPTKYSKAVSSGRKSNVPKVIFTEPISWLDNFNTNPRRHKYFLREVPNRKDEPEDIIEQEIRSMSQLSSSCFGTIGSRAIGRLNPFYTKFKYRPMASHYFYYTAPKCITQCDAFAEDEQEWIHKAMTGGLIYSKPGTRLERAHEYDIKSMYPYLMMYVKFITRQGSFKTIQELPQLASKDKYTIYRCKIEGYDERLFQRNKNDYYTGFDVATAQEEGYKITLYQDDKPNCLVYGEHTYIRGSEVFATFVGDMFKLKEKTKKAKPILNCLWGWLGSKDYEFVKTDDGVPYVEHISMIKKIYIRGYDKDKQVQHYKYAVYKKSPNNKRKVFKFPYARFTCFLTALGRRHMYNTIKDEVDIIHRIHTDGFITDTPIDWLDFGTNMGQWTEKVGACTIQNVNRIEWD